MPAKGVSRVGGLGTPVVLSGAVATAAALTSCGTSDSAAPEQPSRAAPSGGATPSKSPTPAASPSRSAPGTVRLPPLHADYQIGGAYPPPAGVRVVSRDRTAAERQRVAARVNRWIDGCAAKGFDAVEPDDYDNSTRLGLDFAVGEERAEYAECGAYARAFDDRVIVIEHSDSGLRKARSGFAGKLGIVRRDMDVSTPGSADHVRKVR
ncbi:endo alpha-1,4 polygalactosaminidase [Streptomyces graminifolii]|uniref:endo alpha-1,4 polygalactosaminidase n=1 Tax=Streptomyces graminifolii TaxID=1266771 RepID=UPI0040595E6C